MKEDWWEKRVVDNESQSKELQKTAMWIDLKSEPVKILRVGRGEFLNKGQLPSSSWQPPTKCRLQQKTLCDLKELAFILFVVAG